MVSFGGNVFTMKKLLVTFMASFFLLTTPAFALAVDTTTSPTPSPKPGNRLSEVKAKFCAAHEANIKTKMNNLLKFSSNMEAKFSAIANRVETFYETSGKNVANYAALKADIQTKKDAADEALTKAQADVSTFTCTSDTPKEAITFFRTDMQLVKTALKNYRTSIKNLIVAVRGSAAKGVGSSSPSASPSATSTPNATP